MSVLLISCYSSIIGYDATGGKTVYRPLILHNDYNGMKQQLAQHLPAVSAPISKVCNSRPVNGFFAEMLEETGIPVRQ